MTVLPSDIQTPLEVVGLTRAVSHLATWIASRNLQIVPVETDAIPTYQVVIPRGRRVHPLLTIQPPPNNPDVPFQKMRGLTGSPYSNAGSRLAVVQQLNSCVPEPDRKPESYRERFYKIRWKLLDDEVQFDRIRDVLDRVIAKVRQGHDQTPSA